MAFVQSNPFDPNVLFCNKAASSAFPEPTNYVIDLIQPTTVMLNQISKEGIKCKKCGKKKIGDGSYYPSNWNQPMSRDQLSKNHFKWIREGWLTSLLRITMLCFSTKVINWQLHFILLHAGPIACRQLLHHLHSMLNTACQQNRSDIFSCIHVVFKSIHFSMILCRLSHLWSIFNLVKNAHTDPFKLSNLCMRDI